MGYRPSLGVVALTFTLIGLSRVPLAWVLLAVGSSVCAWAWVCLKRLDERQTAPAPEPLRTP